MNGPLPLTLRTLARHQILREPDGLHHLVLSCRHIERATACALHGVQAVDEDSYWPQFQAETAASSSGVADERPASVAGY